MGLCAKEEKNPSNKNYLSDSGSVCTESTVQHSVDVITQNSLSHWDVLLQEIANFQSFRL